MLNLNSLLVFSDNPQQLAEFYSKVFQMEANWSEGDFTGFKVGDCFIAFGPHDKVQGQSQNPERMMFNLETDQVQVEFDRIKNLGGKVVKEPYSPSEDTSMSVATFADPDGNYFQLMSPMQEK